MICVVSDQQRQHERLNDQRRDRIRARSFPTESEGRARFLHRCRYFAESLIDQAESGDGEGKWPVLFKSPGLPVNVRARSRAAGGDRSLIGNSFARNSGSGLRAGLLGRDFVTRGTGGD